MVRADLVYSRSARIASTHVMKTTFSPHQCIVAAALWLIATCGSAFAHDPGLSSATFQLAPTGTEVNLTFNQRDLAAVAGMEAGELRAQSAEVQRKLDATVQRAVVLAIKGESQTAMSMTAVVDANDNVEFHYRFPALNGAAEISFESALLAEMSFGHRQTFAANDARGEALARQVLSGRDHVARFTVGQGAIVSSSGWARFSEFFLLGVHHIVTGYDHLLFLLGLLIVCRGPRTALLLISCFTLAHSLTLALSTFDLVNLPSRWVEATIAASILYVGIENLVRRDGQFRGRWLLTLVFGLIHGLGFASVLREMGVADQPATAFVPLLSFNLGVEAGQLAIAAIVLPIIWKLRERGEFLRVGVPACSIIVAAVGAFWLVERTLLH